MKPRCYNRPEYQAVQWMQDGWIDTYAPDGRKSRVPRMVEVPFRMSTECQQHGPFGEARIHGWDCDGCVWGPRP